MTRLRRLFVARRESKFENGRIYRRRSWVIATRWKRIEEA